MPALRDVRAGGAAWRGPAEPHRWCCGHGAPGRVHPALPGRRAVARGFLLACSPTGSTASTAPAPRCSRWSGPTCRCSSRSRPARLRPAVPGPVRLIEKALHTSQATLVWVTIGVAAYAALELVEGVGLWLMRRWGEYVAVVGTGIFVPSRSTRSSSGSPGSGWRRWWSTCSRWPTSSGPSGCSGSAAAAGLRGRAGERLLIEVQRAAWRRPWRAFSRVAAGPRRPGTPAPPPTW